MSRLIAIVMIVLVLALGGGFLFLGAFPPDPAPRQVERVLPNDRFQSR